MSVAKKSKSKNNEEDSILQWWTKPCQGWSCCSARVTQFMRSNGRMQIHEPICVWSISTRDLEWKCRWFRSTLSRISHALFSCSQERSGKTTGVIAGDIKSTIWWWQGNVRNPKSCIKVGTATHCASTAFRELWTTIAFIANALGWNWKAENKQSRQ